jgi:hypothetical protein
MDAVVLLRHAKEAGLRVEPIGNKLVVRGPKRAEPVVRLLAAHKAEVLAALAPIDRTSQRKWLKRASGVVGLLASHSRGPEAATATGTRPDGSHGVT